MNGFMGTPLVIKMPYSIKNTRLKERTWFISTSPGIGFPQTYQESLESMVMVIIPDYNFINHIQSKPKLQNDTRHHSNNRLHKQKAQNSLSCGVSCLVSHSEGFCCLFQP